jgi:hypothetical protein
VKRLRSTCILALALLGGCAGGPQDTTLDIVSDVCEPTAVIAPADASDAQLASIDEALAMWANLGFDRAERVAADADLGAEQHVRVVFEEAAEMFHGLYDDENGVVYINSVISDDHARAVTVAHELGHSFGLFHVDPGVHVSVMNPANMVVEPNDSDASALVALWGSCGE